MQTTDQGLVNDATNPFDRAAHRRVLRPCQVRSARDSSHFSVITSCHGSDCQLFGAGFAQSAAAKCAIWSACAFTRAT
jgi:hypothetical protein